MRESRYLSIVEAASASNGFQLAPGVWNFHSGAFLTFAFAGIGRPSSVATRGASACVARSSGLEFELLVYSCFCTGSGLKFCCAGSGSEAGTGSGSDASDGADSDGTWRIAGDAAPAPGLGLSSGAAGPGCDDAAAPPPAAMPCAFACCSRARRSLLARSANPLLLGDTAVTGDAAAGGVAGGGVAGGAFLVGVPRPPSLRAWAVASRAAFASLAACSCFCLSSTVLGIFRCF